jgi:glycosyltransferase involved in cell wall biosynthesis
MDELTVIIPIYNGAKTIKQSIESIEKSMNIHYRVIVVDDNSSDNTCEIVKELIKKNNSIELIENSRNFGVSYSRNMGLKKCATKYVTFMDCDDFIIGKTYNKINEFKDEDLIGFDYYELINDKKIKSKFNLTNGVLSADDALAMALTDKLPLSSCTYIYRMNIIKSNHLEFNEKIKIGEDNLFVIEYISYCRNVMLINEYNYVYVQNNSSVMHKLNNNVFQLNEIYKFLSPHAERKCEENQQNYQHFISLCNIKSIHAISNTKSKDKFEYLKKIYDKEKLKYIINARGFSKYVKIESFILLHFGISFHLMMFPFYSKLKNIIRGN